MAAKFGAGLVLLAFGCLMIVAGTIAPASWRQPLSQWAAALTGSAAKVGAAPAGIAAPAVPAKSGVPVARSAGAAPSPSPAAPEPVLADTLLIPTPLPEQAQYALQAGQFTSTDAADALAQRIKTLHLPSTAAIDVVDRAGMRSRVVPVGPYKTLADARMAGSTVARELGLPAPLALMLLPAVPAPAGAAR